MHAELYTDGIGEITVGGAIVRVDLVSLSPTERDENNAPKRVFCQRLIFSVESFANSVDVMQSALQSLVDSGVIRRNQPVPPAAAPSYTPVASERLSELSNAPARSPNVSSNFR